MAIQIALILSFVLIRVYLRHLRLFSVFNSSAEQVPPDTFPPCEPLHHPARRVVGWPYPSLLFRANHERIVYRTRSATFPVGTCPSASTASYPASILHR